MSMDKLTYKMDLIEDGNETSPTDVGRIRITISKDGVELGSLYYEKAKRSFNRKPVGMDAWTCVDAKVEGLYEACENITPTEVMSECQRLIKSSPLAW